MLTRAISIAEMSCEYCFFSDLDENCSAAVVKNTLMFVM